MYGPARIGWAGCFVRSIGAGGEPLAAALDKVCSPASVRSPLLSGLPRLFQHPHRCA